jgi:hypothetical protein
LRADDDIAAHRGASPTNLRGARSMDHFKFSRDDFSFWSVRFFGRMACSACEQMRDLDKVANDNESARMKMEHARAMERFAASRASNPAFAAFVFQAVVEAQKARAGFRPRVV